MLNVWLEISNAATLIYDDVLLLKFWLTLKLLQNLCKTRQRNIDIKLKNNLFLYLK